MYPSSFLDIIFEVTITFIGEKNPIGVNSILLLVKLNLSSVLSQKQFDEAEFYSNFYSIIH